MRQEIQHPNSYLPHPASHRRRGVLILVVLSILVLFALMALTYVLLANKQLSQSKSFNRGQANAVPPQQDLDATMLQVLRGSNNPHSPISVWGLLGDMYGDPMSRTLTSGSVTTTFYGPNSVRGYVVPGASNPVLVAGGQITEMLVAPRSIPVGSTTPIEFDEFSKLEGYYEGCVLTMTSGALRGQSTRIVRYTNYQDPDSANPTDDRVTIHVVTFKSSSGTIALAPGDTFLINGRPFSGTGFGYNSLNGPSSTLNAMYDPDSNTGTNNSLRLALLLNPAYLHTGENDSGTASTYNLGTNDYGCQGPGSPYPFGIPFGGLGGANEDYDAADYQNLHLSFSAPTGQVILPSFHRPDLINYWRNRSGTPVDWTNQNDLDGDGTPGDAARLLRRICLRPTPVDHPYFTGSNPNLDFNNNPLWQTNLMGIDPSGNPLSFSPWDIDNDGDGIADSVWLDLGFPVRTTLDGRKYKPLFAIHCVDLDGRVNVNAHGNSMQSAMQPTGSQIAASKLTPWPSFDATGTIAAGAALPFGQGFGPADINLRAVFTETETAAILSGFVAANGQPYLGRYGEQAAGATLAQSGFSLSSVRSPLSLLKHFQWPEPTFNPAASPPVILPQSSYGTIADFWGRAQVGLDFRGQPIYWKPPLVAGAGWAGETAFSPYDLDLSRNGPRPGGSSSNTSADDPYTVFDLEGILRQWDIDTTALSSRLTAVASSPGNIAAWRTKITSDSWDLPSPGIAAPPHLRDDLNNLYGRSFASTVVELLASKIRPALQSANSTWSATQLDQATGKEIRRLLSPELIAGLRMNINRPLGDGRDSDGNGVVDEATLSELQNIGQTGAANVSKWVQAFNNTNITFALSNGVDVNNDGVVNDVDNLMARQLMARHLYVLARLFFDEQYLNVATNVQWFGEQGLNPTDKQKLAIRRIAQWAVNVVDFMDQDNICTPFEYDLDPFTAENTTYPGQTWNVDGVLGQNTNGTTDDTQGYRGLVWGCEAPALMLTETLAFHDMAMKDSKFDSTGKDVANGDLDPDQRRIPQGSAFFELYCPGDSSAQAIHAGDLYQLDTSSGQWSLHLGRLAPPDNNGKVYPVWRLAISLPHVYGTQTTPSPKSLLDPDGNGDVSDGKYDTLSFETEQYPGDPNANASLLPGGNQKFQIERIVWFTGALSPQTYPNPDRIYYRRNGPEFMRPGQYMVVGPRQYTRIGWTTTAATSGDYQTPANEPSTQKIRLLRAPAGMVDIFDHALTTANYPAVGTTIQPPLAMTVGIGSDADKPPGWIDTQVPSFATRFPEGIGISVSEPLISAYYEEPLFARSSFDNESTAAKIYDCYGPLREQLETQNPRNLKFLNVPEDTKAGKPLQQIKQATYQKTGSYLNYKTVFLQRLANPLVSYDPITNPYLTVDWMPIDLTVFNGDDSGNSLNTSTAPNQFRFASRQRGKLSTYTPSPNIQNTTQNSNSLLWWQYSDDPEATQPGPTAALVFKHELKYYAAPTTQNATALAGATQHGLHTLGFLNGSYGYPLRASQLGPGLGAYVGDPHKPFPWLQWNNRPYSSIAELMLVPATSPARLLTEFTTITNGQPYNQSNNTPQNQRAPFNHLLNFFHSSDGSSGVGQSAAAANVLEFLEVPSPFVGTEMFLNPQQFVWSGGPVGTEPPGTEGLHPPFSVVSNYRVPGKVNINTIADPAVWSALLGGDQATHLEIPGTTFANLVNSRRGDALTGYSFNPSLPSIVSNPFRSACAADLNAAAVRRPVAVTLLRPYPDNPGSAEKPLMDAASTQPYNDVTRNPSFKYQALTRTMGNITTRSNVYAVWITVGYFEVSPHQNPAVPAGPNSVYPDGYWLGQELGADTGEITRHRAFYIIDRTIPVGYERGQNHNVLDAVLLRRMIE
ncbi:MAG: hypothetical protein IT427_18570 [Pirellulales bacterium]|nr:hypothetical protein [Pirellulales bacterium]